MLRGVKGVPLVCISVTFKVRVTGFIVIGHGFRGGRG